MATASKYTAFISYSAQDRGLGQRFHTALERFRVPRALRGRVSQFGRIGKGIGPIFRDRTDLASHESLSDALTEALADSRYLVVLCSPSSAASRWVNEEIREFRRLGRADRVIPVLVGGEPDVFAADTRPSGAFPPALIADLDPGAEPFAPDLRESHARDSGDGFEMGLLKVLARMLDVPLSELTQRHFEAERRKRRLALAVAGVMAVLAVGASVGGWYSWQQTLLANTRLSQTIEVAARQIDVARRFRSRYGVPRAVINELFSGAENDFEIIVTQAGTTPELSLGRARLALSLAEFAEVIERREMRDFYLDQADAAITELDSGKTAWPVQMGLMEDVPESAVRRQRLDILHRRSDAALRDRSIPAGLGHSERAMYEARLAADSYPEDPGWQRAVVQALCSHGERLYRVGSDAMALKITKECVDEWRGRVLAARDAQDKLGLVRALNQEAILRRALDDRETSLKLQAEAAELASKLAEDNPDSTLLGTNLFTALLWHADALQAASRPAGEQLAALAEAEAYAERVAASDPARMDWQRNLAIVLERRVSLEAQLICTASQDTRRDLLAEADDRARRAVALHEARVARDRDDPRALRDLSVALNARAVVLADHADLAPEGREAVLTTVHDLLARSEKIASARVEATGGSDRVALHDLAETRIKLARITTLRRQPGDISRAQFELAEHALRKLLKEKDAPPAWTYELAILKVSQAQDLARLDEAAEAGIALQEARDLADKLSTDHPGNRQYETLAHALVTFDPFVAAKGSPGC